MPIDSILNDTLNKMALDTVQGKDKTDKFAKPNDVNNQLLENLAGAESAITTISALGQQINDIQQTLKGTGHDQALEGFKSVITQVARNPNDPNNFDFLQTAKALSQEDPNQLSQVFSTVDTLKDQNMDNQTYLTTVSNTYQNSGAQGVSDLNDSVNTILTADNTEGKSKTASTLQNYLSTVNEIMNSEQKPEVKEKFFAELNAGTQNENFMQAINQFINNFIGRTGLIA